MTAAIAIAATNDILPDCLVSFCLNIAAHTDVLRPVNCVSLPQNASERRAAHSHSALGSVNVNLLVGTRNSTRLRPRNVAWQQAATKANPIAVRLNAAG